MLIVRNHPARRHRHAVMFDKPEISQNLLRLMMVHTGVGLVSVFIRQQWPVVQLL